MPNIDMNANKYLGRGRSRRHRYERDHWTLSTTEMLYILAHIKNKTCAKAFDSE